MNSTITVYLILQISSLKFRIQEQTFDANNPIEKDSQFIYYYLHLDSMSEKKKSESVSSDNDKLNKEMLKPVTKSDTDIEDELKDLEVENSGGGKDGGGG